MFVVVVEFSLKPGQEDAFLPLIVENARLSLETEPGCRQFDVCVAPERRDHVFLYELYDDRAAFDAHCATEHFRRFDAVSRDLVAQKEVRLLHRRHP